MNVKEMPDGKLLVICRAGCDIQSILEATGQPWSVLFAEDNERRYFREAKASFPVADVLRALEFEALVICLITADVKNKKEVKQEEWDRLAIAYQRIESARKMAIGDD